MAEKGIHITYSIEDIERYLNGSMNSAEMHEMERAALNDPFLADAIEGYGESDFTTSHLHLNEINAALYKKREEARVIPIASKKFTWLNAAAIAGAVMLTGALSWYLISLNNSQKKENNTTAIAEVQAEKKAPDPVISKPVDTSAVIAALPKQKSVNPGVVHNQSDQKQSEIISSTPNAGVVTLNDQDIATAKNTDKKNEQSVTTFSAQPSTTRQDSTLVVSSRKALEANQSVLIYNGRVLDNNNRPVVSASVIANGGNAVLTDNEGYFSLRAADSVLDVTVSSVGFERANTTLNSNVSNKIIIQPDDQSLSEVVTTGFGKKREADKKKTDSSLTYPSGGWESFQEYVYKQLNREMDTTLSSVQVTGDVQLEFTIDAAGAPENFKVVKSLNPLSDKKAIDIVKKGPRWITGNKNKKARVVIKF